MRMRTLALDLALGVVGWAVLDVGPQLVQCGHFTLPDRRKGEDRADWNARRAKALRERLQGLVRDWLPDLLAYEYPDEPRRTSWRNTDRGKGANVGTEFTAAQGLGLAEGLLICATLEPHYPPYTVRAIGVTAAKRHVTNNPHASKDLVQKRLLLRYGWTILDQNEADAVAVGLCAQAETLAKRAA